MSEEDNKKGGAWLWGGATLATGLIVAFGALSGSDNGIDFPAGTDTLDAIAAGTAGAAGDAADAAGDATDAAGDAAGDATDAAGDATDAAGDAVDDAADAAGDAAGDATDAAGDAVDAVGDGLDVIPAVGSDGAELGCTLKPATAKTALTLDPAVATALEGAGVAVAPIKPAAANAGAIDFQMKSTRVSCDGRSGFLGHRGGLKFTAGDQNVELRRYRVDIASGEVVAFPKSTGTASIEPFTFDFSATEAPEDAFALNDVPVNLTAAGASALNDGLGVSVFEDGQNIGTVAVTGERS